MELSPEIEKPEMFVTTLTLWTTTESLNLKINSNFKVEVTRLKFDFQEFFEMKSQELFYLKLFYVNFLHELVTNMP